MLNSLFISMSRLLIVEFSYKGYFCVCLCEFIDYMCSGALRGLKRTHILWNCSHGWVTMWMLGTEPTRTSEKAVSILNCWAVTPTLNCRIFKWHFSNENFGFLFLYNATYPLVQRKTSWSYFLKWQSRNVKQKHYSKTLQNP